MITPTPRLRHRRVQSVLAVVGATAILCGTTGASADTANTSTHGGNTATAAFKAEVESTYAAILKTSAEYPVPGTHAPEGQAEFTKVVESLTAAQLDALRRADPGIWTRIRSAVHKVPEVGPTQAPPPAPTVTARPSTPPAADDRLVTAPSSRPIRAASLPARPDDTPPTDDVYSAPVLPYNVAPIQCPPTTLISGILTAKLILQESAIGISTAVDALTDPLILVVAGEGGAFSNPVVQLLRIVQFSLEGIVAGLEWSYGQVNNCYEGIFLSVVPSSEADMQLLGQDTQVLAKGENRILDKAGTISDAIGSGFAGIDSRNSSLQGSVDTAQTSLDEALRQHIEAALTSGRADVDFELPASMGGYLDATPIGVRKIVTDALAALRAAGQPVGSAAPHELALAEKALAAKQYKQAYRHYQNAYRAITR